MLKMGKEGNGQNGDLIMPLFPPKRSFNVNINYILKTTIYQYIVLLTSSGKYVYNSQ
jgi:hypothetical protein